MALRPPTKHPGLMDAEERVVALADSGVGNADIARRLGVTISFVRSTVSQFAFANCWRVGDAADAETRTACRRYADALAATGKRYA